MFWSYNTEKEVCKMLIKVHYSDDRYDLVNESTLHRMIETGKIMRFQRSSGWVVVGLDETRSRLRTETNKAHGVSKKMIQVLYNSMQYDYVSDTLLDNLLASNKIASFKRSTGWVRVGMEPVRTNRRSRCEAN
jgi:hypothetical protein